MRKLLRTSFYLIFFVLFVAIGLELALRVFDPIGIQYVFETKPYFKIMKKDPDYSYIHTPGTEMMLQGAHVRINKEGFRGPDFPIKKPKENYRILIYGDSVVFGWGVEEEESLAPQLQALLPKTIQNRKTEVIGAGVGSWNTRTQYEFFEKRGKDYEPDMIIWLIVNNDIMPKSSGKSLISQKELRAYKKELRSDSWFDSGKILNIRKKLSLKSYLAASLERFLSVKKNGKSYEIIYRPNSPQIQDAADALKKLTALSKELKIPLYPFIHGEKQSPIGKRYHEIYSELLDEEEVPYFSFPEEIYELHHRNSLVDPHQNAKGLKIMAKAIQEQVPWGIVLDQGQD